MVPSDGAEIKARRYTPAGEEGKTYPLLYWIHGGGKLNKASLAEALAYFHVPRTSGFIFPGLELDDFFLRSLCVDSQITIVAVDYKYVRSCLFDIVTLT